MKTELLVSQRIVTEFASRLQEILANAPRQVEILPFTKDLRVAADDLPAIEAAYYSRDIWEGTEKSA
jgi:hypothetical protein